MKISISITPEEAVTLANKLKIDPNLLLESVSKYATLTQAATSSNIPNNYSLEMLYDWFEKVSWPTFYFCHLIIVQAKVKQQQDNYGYFLSAEQLDKLDIPERSASSRVGGSRRVCKTINSIDILFIRTQSKENKKLFYVNNDAVADLKRIINEFDDEYREALKSENLSYPNGAV